MVTLKPFLHDMTQLFLTSPLYDKILKTVHNWTFRERERERDRQTDRERY